MARKRRTTKKAKPKAKPKPAPKPKGPQPGEIPLRTSWYLESPDSVTLAEPEEEVYRVTLRDPRDRAVAAAYGRTETQAKTRALKLYAALAPKGKK